LRGLTAQEALQEADPGRLSKVLIAQEAPDVLEANVDHAIVAAEAPEPIAETLLGEKARQNRGQPFVLELVGLELEVEPRHNWRVRRPDYRRLR